MNLTDVIFPKIEEAIQMTLASSGDLHKRRLAISEKPAGDYSEKIFNVYDLRRSEKTLSVFMCGRKNGRKTATSTISIIMLLMMNL